jgi:hypothetical protein
MNPAWTPYRKVSPTPSRTLPGSQLSTGEDLLEGWARVEGGRATRPDTTDATKNPATTSCLSGGAGAWSPSRSTGRHFGVPIRSEVPIT